MSVDWYPRLIPDPHLINTWHSIDSRLGQQQANFWSTHESVYTWLTVNTQLRMSYLHMTPTMEINSYIVPLCMFPLVEGTLHILKLNGYLVCTVHASINMLEPWSPWYFSVTGALQLRAPFSAHPLSLQASSLIPCVPVVITHTSYFINDEKDEQKWKKLLSMVYAWHSNVRIGKPLKKIKIEN